MDLWLDWEKNNIINGWCRASSDGAWIVTVQRTSRSAKNRWRVELSVADEGGGYTGRHRYLIKEAVDVATAQLMAMAFTMGRTKALSKS